MMSMVSERDDIISDALKHLESMPIKIESKMIMWANSDHTWVKDTEGHIKTLEAWRDELTIILKGG